MYCIFVVCPRYHFYPAISFCLPGLHHMYKCKFKFCPSKSSLFFYTAVPLCPKHPHPQLEYVVKDCQASAIITTSDLAHKIKPILSGQQVVFVENTCVSNHYKTMDYSKTISCRFYHNINSCQIYHMISLHTTKNISFCIMPAPLLPFPGYSLRRVFL